MHRHYSLSGGAEPVGDATRFRLWAPPIERVTLRAQTVADDELQVDLTPSGTGWHELTLGGVGAGTLYRYEIDRRIAVPDPVSRYNPQGVHGPSEVVDPRGFRWSDDDWTGRPPQESVIYELHVGTFTPEGTFTAIIPRLASLAKLGITVLELMPVATFQGQRGWGYDGVLPYAPHPAYGRPDDLKQLVQAAHRHGLSILLDVVYNHFGPEGNFLYEYLPEFFTSRYRTPWGDAIDFDPASSGRAREFFLNNALYWLDEYHFDGLRIDAVHAICDDSPIHFINELANAIAVGPGKSRHVHLVLENHNNEAVRLKRKTDARLHKAQWNDDIHHLLHVIVTGENDGYYRRFQQRPVQQLGRALAEGFAYQGEPYGELGHPRGEPSKGLPPTAFVNFLQNHDQIGNRAFGERLAQLTSAERLHAALTILLLAPQTPMLFMGEEYAAPQPFLYFCNYEGELARAITEGRRAEFAQFAAFAGQTEQIPDPNAHSTFDASRLEWQQREMEPHAKMLSLVQSLLELRATHVVPLIARLKPGTASYAVEGALLRMVWPTEKVALVLLANLSDDSTAVAVDADTQLLYSTEQEPGATRLSAWEVRLLRRA
jgi:maltooligosyltrehalose trehalohydrolase